MEKTRLVLLSLLFLTYGISAVQEWQVIAKNGSLITMQHYYAHKINNELLTCMKQVFLQSFTDAYKDIPLEELGVSNRANFLQQLFSDEEETIKRHNTRDHFIIAAHCNNTLVGFISFNVEENHCCCIRSLAISPACKGLGIGQHLVMQCHRYDKQLAALVFLPHISNESLGQSVLDSLLACHLGNMLNN